MKNLTEGLKALTVPEELKEVMAIGALPPSAVKLRRTFNQSDFQGGYVKFWRVIGPEGHRSLNSDLSLQGLKDWNIIQTKETI